MMIRILASIAVVLLTSGMVMGLTRGRPKSGWANRKGPFWKVPAEAFDSQAVHTRYIVGRSFVIIGAFLVAIAAVMSLLAH